jgi:hypothetical protein
MRETVDKAVWVEDMERAHDVVDLIERTYPGPEWTGAMLFRDTQGGLVLVCCFDPELYPCDLPAWEALHPPRDVRVLTMADMAADGRRYRPFLEGGLSLVLGRLKLLPTRSS